MAGKTTPKRNAAKKLIKSAVKASKGTSKLRGATSKSSKLRTIKGKAIVKAVKKRIKK